MSSSTQRFEGRGQSWSRSVPSAPVTRRELDYTPQVFYATSTSQLYSSSGDREFKSNMDSGYMLHEATKHEQVDVPEVRGVRLRTHLHPPPPYQNKPYVSNYQLAFMSDCMKKDDYERFHRLREREIRNVTFAQFLFESPECVQTLYMAFLKANE